MNRRAFLAAATALPLAPPALARPAARTRWAITTSVGFDAIAFLGPLSGQPLYLPYYEAEVAAFAAHFKASAALQAVQIRADAAGKLLWPTVANVLSYGPTDTLDDLLASVEAAERRVLPAYRAGRQWDAASWDFVTASRDDLRVVFAGLREAGFEAFRASLVGDRPTARAPELLEHLAGYDVIAEQERLVGRKLDPTIGVVLLWFSKPHAASVGGQRSLSHFDYPAETVVRIAAHEMLHPPFPMDGPAATAALRALNASPLMVRILNEHDPAFGYNSMEGILDEDMAEALDQIVSERLGVAREPGERWRKADGGMHVLAAALYGMLKAEGYDRTGGDIERWMAEAAANGKLAPDRLVASAAQVLGLPADRLWTPRPSV